MADLSAHRFVATNSDSSRTRDVFPLPCVNSPILEKQSQSSRVIRQRSLRKFRTVNWLNDGIAVLNDLAGRGRFSQGVPNFAQRLALDQLLRRTSASDVRRRVPPAGFCPEESLKEILHSSHAYGDSCTVAPYLGGLGVLPSARVNPRPLIGVVVSTGPAKTFGLASRFA